MKINKIYVVIFVITFLTNIFTLVSKSSASGVAAGIEFDVLNNIITSSNIPLATDHIFVGGDAFASYYNDKSIDYGYGFRGRLGYKIFGAQAYGLAGVGHFGFDRNKPSVFKDNTAPIYGYGIGYNFPLSIGVRLNRTFFSLERVDNRKQNFAFTEVQLVLAF